MDDRSVRCEYQKYGVKNFYTFYGQNYNNPHFKSIEKSLIYVKNNWDIDLNNVLDLACGKGEVTKILLSLGFNKIEALDGYLCKEYTKETGKSCHDMKFEDIIKGKLLDKNYSTIICSYALHLLDVNKLPTFLLILTQITDNLLIISPHKKPIIKDDWGWYIEEEIYLDRTRTRWFKKNINL